MLNQIVDAKEFEVFFNSNVMPILYEPGAVLRSEYQPACISKLINSAYGESPVQTQHLGCGGGKSVIFLVALAHLILTRKIKNGAIIAPTQSLTLQLQLEFAKIYNAMIESGYYGSPISTNSINVSAMDIGKKKNSKKTENDDLFDELDAEEKAESAADKETLEQSEEELKKVSEKSFARFTQVRTSKELETQLEQEDRSVYFICKPSFIKKFAPMVIEKGLQIDVTCFDEYHNLISQNKREVLKKLLTTYAECSPVRWHFSATKKQGAIFSYTDEVFGHESVDIKSSQLVKWGYLVESLKVFLIRSAAVKGISEAVRNFFQEIKIDEPEKFYKEMAVIIYMMQFMKKFEMPKAIVFSAAVKFIKLMAQNPAFINEIQKHFDEPVVLSQIDGKTANEDREIAFEQIQQSASAVATLLLNHSVIKEGIDIKGLNTALIARGMSQHSLQQALGRIQRTGKNKKCAYLFVYIDADETDIIKQKLIELALDIHYTLGDLPYIIEDAHEDKTGAAQRGDDIIPNCDDINLGIKQVKIDIEESIAKIMNSAIEDTKMDEYAASLPNFDLAAAIWG